jgi:serine/threonine protein kinase
MHEQLESNPPVLEGAVELAIGDFVGAYRIISLLDVGGMGRVYLAERADGTFERVVAIKMIDASAFNADSIPRFEDECRILASLHDPTIATLFDAGRTPDGALYIVMEYVDGVPITTYCDQRKLGTHQRVALFLRVCHAVGLAHQNLIVHRDLKPGNVLVQADGTPKLLDFGIAKMLTKSGREATPPTLPVYRRATPAYASAEQLSGAPANTGMDVFALGVMLHELLTGGRPEPVDTSTPTTDNGYSYLKPSIIAARADGDGARNRLDEDLDAIILKAIGGPASRYPSVETLTADLQAYLDTRPVSASAQTYSYLARKFVIRNRALTALAAVAVVAVVIAAVAIVRTSQQARRERDALRERAEAAQTLTASLFDVDRALRDITGATLPRQTLVESINRYLDRLDRISGSDGRVDRDIAASLRRVAEILGNPNSANIGDRRRALAAYARATDILRRLQHSDANPDLMYELAITRAGTADVLAAQNDADGAHQAYDEALGIAKTLRDTSPDARYESLAAGIHRSIGDLLLAGSQAQGALTEYQEALNLEQMLAQRSADPERQRLMALTHVRIGSAQARRGAWDESRAEYATALDTMRALGSGRPQRAVMRDTAVALLQLGQSIQAIDPVRADTATTQGIEILRQLAHDEPTDARVQHDLLAGLVQYGDAQHSMNAANARAAYREAQSIAQALNVAHDAESEHDLAVVTQRLVGSPSTRALQLDLYVLVNGKRTPFKVDERLPATATQLAVNAETPKGWSRYVIAFGSNGKATILDERDLQRAQSILPIAGPPPAETILLLVVPQALGEDQRTKLATDIAAVPGPRSLDYDGQVVWNSDTEERIVSQTTARGGVDTGWINEVRAKLLALKGVRFYGRTFPIQQ